MKESSVTASTAADAVGEGRCRGKTHEASWWKDVLGGQDRERLVT